MPASHHPSRRLSGLGRVGRFALTVAVFSTACLTVNIESEVERERIDADNHDPLFPLSTGKHQERDCNDCHGEFDSFTLFSCIGCHEHSAERIDPTHGGIVDYDYSATGCFDCHPRGEMLTREAHASNFPITIWPHAETPCEGCHPTDYASFECTECHAHTCEAMIPVHEALRMFNCNSQGCAFCHPSGQGTD